MDSHGYLGIKWWGQDAGWIANRLPRASMGFHWLPLASHGFIIQGTAGDHVAPEGAATGASCLETSLSRALHVIHHLA